MSVDGKSGCNALGSEIADALRDTTARLGPLVGLRLMRVSEDVFERDIDDAGAYHCRKTCARIAALDESRETLLASMRVSAACKIRMRRRQQPPPANGPALCTAGRGSGQVHCDAPPPARA